MDCSKKDWEPCLLRGVVAAGGDSGMKGVESSVTRRGAVSFDEGSFESSVEELGGGVSVDET